MPEAFAPLPRVGAWRHVGAYEGHEVVRFTTDGGAIVLEGTSVGVEDGMPWTIDYRIEVNSDWHARAATLRDHLGTTVEIETDGSGAWTVNGEPRPDLDGCLDIDLEASVVTNTLPVHRLALSIGQRGESSAAYLRTVGLEVERLDQTYERLADDGDQRRFDYASPRFGYRDVLAFEADGLTLSYPGIGERIPLTGGSSDKKLIAG